MAMNPITYKPKEPKPTVLDKIGTGLDVLGTVNGITQNPLLRRLMR